jgi:hypothetical protein
MGPLKHPGGIKKVKYLGYVELKNAWVVGSCVVLFFHDSHSHIRDVFFYLWLNIVKFPCALNL